MTDRLLSRAHLEALCVAIARVNDSFTELLLASLDRDRVSPSCWALLEECDGAEPFAWIRTQGQQKLSAAVDRLTNLEMVEYSPATLIALVNALPVRVKPPARWERDLALATGTAA